MVGHEAGLQMGQRDNHFLRTSGLLLASYFIEDRYALTNIYILSLLHLFLLCFA